MKPTRGESLSGVRGRARGGVGDEAANVSTALISCFNNLLEQAFSLCQADRCLDSRLIFGTQCVKRVSCNTVLMSSGLQENYPRWGTLVLPFEKYVLSDVVHWMSHLDPLIYTMVSISRGSL